LNAKKGKFDDIDADIFVRNYSAIKGIARDYQEKPATLPPVDEVKIGYWYVGEAGCGKSFDAYAACPNAYIKNSHNKWWCGYQDEEDVIVDDFDIRDAALVQQVKWWGDRFPFNCENKGGGFFLRPKRVIITSNYHPEDIWQKDADLKPILRRYHIVRYTSDVAPIVGYKVDEKRIPYMDRQMGITI
jgi:hypothetical protein